MIHGEFGKDIGNWKNIIHGIPIRKQNNRLQFILFYLFIFISFLIILYFSIFRTLGLGLKLICHTVTSVIFDGVVTTVITELKRKK